MSYDFELIRPKLMKTPHSLNTFKQPAAAYLQSESNRALIDGEDYRPAAIRALKEINAAFELREANIGGKDIMAITYVADGSGIEIMLCDDKAFLGIPFCHGAGESEQVFQKAWNYLKVISDIGKLLVLNSQEGVVIDLEEEFNLFLPSYKQMCEVLGGGVPR